jgi:hypothetical protein
VQEARNFNESAAAARFFARHRPISNLSGEIPVNFRFECTKLELAPVATMQAFLFLAQETAFEAVQIWLS